MNKFAVLIYRKVKEKARISIIFCSSCSSAEYYVSSFTQEENNKIVALLNVEQRVISLKKGESVVPFLNWLNKNVPNWKAN
ncbi:MAG: hypothetical protein PHZ25_00075 [Candidatus Pacebacteria bacterium]|nr:hypothetical protein [Candidatus Paceibacterota bacterium]